MDINSGDQGIPFSDPNSGELLEIGISPQEIHVFHHDPLPIFGVKIERNSRGYNYEVKYSGPDIDIVLAQIQQAETKLHELYGTETSPDAK